MPSFHTRSELASVGFDWCVETGKKKYAEKQDPERWVEFKRWVESERWVVGRWQLWIVGSGCVS